MTTANDNRRPPSPQPREDTIIDTAEMMNDMPWTREQLTREQFEAWLASRKEAGRVINIETCEILRKHAYDCDPYGKYDVLPMSGSKSAPPATCARPQATAGSKRGTSRSKSAMHDRIDRNQGLWEAVCAVHPMFEAAGLRQCKWKGEGEEPSTNAMREWFKVNHPTLASEAEREIRTRIKEKREQAVDFEPPF